MYLWNTLHWYIQHCRAGFCSCGDVFFFSRGKRKKLQGLWFGKYKRQFKCHRNTIMNLGQRFQQSGSVRDAAHTDRPKVTTACQDRYITFTHLRKRFKEVPALSLAYLRKPFLTASHKSALPMRVSRPYLGRIINHFNLRLLWPLGHLRWIEPWGLKRWRVPFQSQFCWWRDARFFAAWMLCRWLFVETASILVWVAF